MELVNCSIGCWECMYLYAAFFKEDTLHSKRCYYNKGIWEHIKTVFPNYKELSDTMVDACIGFLKGKENKDKSCFILDTRNFQIEEDYMSFEFELSEELDINSEFIDKSLYRLARKLNWINSDFKFYPLLCILGREDFDMVRKGMPNTRKISSKSAQIDEYRLRIIARILKCLNLSKRYLLQKIFGLMIVISITWLMLAVNLVNHKTA